MFAVRCRFALALMGGALFGVGQATAAYPERSIQLVVSMLPGGGADTVARIVAAKLSEQLGQAVVVENRAGAEGRIAANFVAHAKPDGYTLAWITNSQTSPSDAALNYDPVESFTPVTLISQTTDVLVALKSFPPNTMQELVALAKAKPGELNFSTAGVGTPSDLEMRLLMQATGIKVVGVAYQGGGQAINAVTGGFVQLYFSTFSTALGQLKAGTLKALAVSTKARSAVLPDIPTVGESLGLPDFDVADWLGVLAPANLSPDVAAKLNASFVAAANSPDVRDRLTSLGWTVVANTPDQFKAVMKKDIATWAALNKSLTAK